MGKGITTTRKSLVTGRSVKPCIQTNARCAPHYKRTALHLSACVSVRLCVCSSLMLSYLYRENNYTLRVKSPTLFLSTPVLLRHSPSPAGQLNDILKLLAVSTLLLGWWDGLATLSPQPSAVPFGGYLGGFFCCCLCLTDASHGNADEKTLFHLIVRSLSRYLRNFIPLCLMHQNPENGMCVRAKRFSFSCS